MKITKVSYERFDIKLATPYTIAYETVSKSVNFILKLESEGLIVGYGCAAPDEVVTGETAEQVEQAIQNTIVPLLKGRNPFAYIKIIEELKQLLKDYSSTLAMVDMALYDLISRKADVPLYQFLGGFRSSIPTSITIGILSSKETIEQAREFVRQGFFILKIKGGLQLEEDIEKMKLLREKFPELVLRFDGNQGYSVAESIAFVNATDEVGIEIFEQPTKIGKEENLGEVTKNVGLPVMADESIKTLADAFRLAQHQRIDMVNIKIMKVGGIVEGLHVNSVAKSANLEAMVGCIDECSLGISAGLHFALSRPNIQFADLDGHLDMLNDPFTGLFHLKKGILYPSDSPGLGNVNL
ncbi:mandelate racemase/muconate lactonizing enzyme family protein [Kriegella aquimaris]|uniref:Dipeptide epimerase n=1 Tax=Kriegella aquimaris TaxID=192904 RepID=A0A1G9THS5_9FLAO|nr:dipeptide epimerase [Kriegella aquimaris]SDM47068.1 L-alanine-DL-glutamate epimerase [Kriegella aquimaris]